MGRRLQSAFAATDPDGFAQLLGEADDVPAMLALLGEISGGLECDVVARLNPTAFERLVASMPVEILARWVDNAPIDAGQRMVARLNRDRTDAVVAAIGVAHKRRDLRRLSTYPPGSIGDMARPDMLTVAGDETADQILPRLQRGRARPESPIVVLRHDGSAMGVLDLMKLMQHGTGDVTAADLCIRVEPLQARSPVRELRLPPQWSRLTSLPVVDRLGYPVGYVSRSMIEAEARTRSEAGLILDSVFELTRLYSTFLFHVTSWLFDRSTTR